MTTRAGRRERTPRTPRTGRDWFVDSLCFALAVLVGGLIFLFEYEASQPAGVAWDWRNSLDVLLGVVAVVALWWRRDFPVLLAVAVAPVAVMSSSSSVAAAIITFTVAVHRRWPVAALVTVLHLGVSAAYFAVRPAPEAWWVQMVWSVVFGSAVLAWGMFVRARRQLVASLRERAERAEREQLVEVEAARAAERTRIAREMHDVLAHKVSLVALHAGGLEIRPDLPPDEVRDTARLIGTTARQALVELRDVIGVLRGPSGEVEAPSAPQPTIRDVARLVTDSQRAGERVTLVDRLDPADLVPGSIGRAAYRIVQEALTNVHKHASGTTTVVAVSGRPADELVVEVRNRLPVGRRSDLPGGGAGLVGLAERVSLAGGTLTHGPTDDGSFAVTARLAWPA